MSPYALELAHARIDALRALIDAMNEAETPEEKRRCAVAIFNAPEPNDFDDEIELVDDDDDESDNQTENEDIDDGHDTPGTRESAEDAREAPVSPASPPLPTALTRTSDIPRSTSSIIAQATALVNSGAFDHLISPHLSCSPP